ncbi:MAG: tripartite tricarboxylate transporter substrate binding protein [Burkholderiales bacterium]|nr:tripartite tricarboxylate transporter substrate binding protein [Burkholderiales bacterium]
MLAAALSALPALAAAAVAPLRLDDADNAYPSRGLRIVVPFPPGASTDSIARIIAEPIEQRLGSRLSIENRSGAGGNIGAEAVVRARPDGHTWLIGTAGLLSINALIYPAMRFDPAIALAPITLVARIPYVLVVHPSIPVRSVGALIEFAGRRPWILNYGSAGNGSTIHLAAELFKAMTGTKIVHVPYRGGAPAIGELFGGHLHMMFSSVPLALSYIESKRLRPLAVTGASRALHLSAVPTMQEAGVAGFEFTGWFALLVPGRTPARIVAWLNEELVAVLSAPIVRARLEAIGAEPASSTPVAVHELMRRDTWRWQRVIQSAKIKPDWEDFPQ